VPPRFAAEPGGASWWYDGPSLTLHVKTAHVDLAKGPYTLELKTLPVNDTALSGLKGAFAHSNLAKDNLDQSRSVPGFASWDGDDMSKAHVGALSRLASVGDALSHLGLTDLKAFGTLLSGYKATLADAIVEVAPLTGGRAAYARALLSSAMN